MKLKLALGIYISSRSENTENQPCRSSVIESPSATMVSSPSNGRSSSQLFTSSSSSNSMAASRAFLSKRLRNFVNSASSRPIKDATASLFSMPVSNGNRFSKLRNCSKYFSRTSFSPSDACIINIFDSKFNFYFPRIFQLTYLQVSAFRTWLFLADDANYSSRTTPVFWGLLYILGWYHSYILLIRRRDKRQEKFR